MYVVFCKWLSAYFNTKCLLVTDAAGSHRRSNAESWLENVFVCFYASDEDPMRC